MYQIFKNWINFFTEGSDKKLNIGLKKYTRISDASKRNIIFSPPISTKSKLAL